MTDPADPLAPQPPDAAASLPARCYAQPQAAALDTRAVFARSWQLVANAAQVEASGDHVPAEIAGVPLAIVRDRQGELRALHNVCRHRAGPLVTCAGRGAEHLQCRYHGWRYGLDGRLLGAPDMGRAPGFDVASIRLPQARIAVRQNLVFAALDDVPPFESLFEGIEARLGADAFGGFEFDRRIVYEIACNWKVYVDNFLEGYHVAHVHPGLAGLLDAGRYTTTLAEWHSLQASPLAASGPYARGEALYYWLYPNTMLNILPGRLQTNRVLAVDHGRCKVEFDYYYAAEVAPEDRRRDQQFSDEVQREDSAICEAVQRGLASGSYTSGRLHPQREAALAHFHELLRAAYRSDRDRLGSGSAV